MVLFCSANEFDDLYRAVADKAGSVRLQAKGGSMYPFIQSGDWVTVSCRNDGRCDLRKGDIILFKKDDSLYMHRVIKNDKGVLLTKGDQSFGADGVIFEETVLGRVLSVERSGRSIDTNSGINRLISSFMADGAFWLQYIFLFIRKFMKLGQALIYRVQGLRSYRRVVKKITKTDAIIREAGFEDAEGIKDLFCMGGHDTKKDIIDIKKEGFWLVAERRGKIVSALTVTRFENDPKLWVIFGLEVKPLLRGLGIGELITKNAVLKAKAGGAKKVGLFVNKRAIPALKMYQKIGFRESDDFPKEFNKSTDEFYLSYEIND